LFNYDVSPRNKKLRGIHTVRCPNCKKSTES
jgi:hypothetical protein